MSKKNSWAIRDWDKVPRDRVATRQRKCPKCGAAPFSPCVRERSGRVTGLPEAMQGAYLVPLKGFHKERRPGAD